MSKVKIKQFRNKAKEPVAGLTPEHAVYDTKGVRLDAKLGSWNLSNIRDAQTEGVRAVREAAKQYDHQTVINNGTITNAADEEDITVRDNVLSLKDRIYIEGIDEMGYVILRKNKPFAEQVIKNNTIYEIRYNFILNEDVTIPDNCVLKFNGGSLSGGRTIIGNNTTINYSVGYNIFNDCNIKGFNIPYLDVRWFGAISDYNIVTGEGTDSSFAFQRAFNNAINSLGTYVYICGKYKIATQVDVYGDFLMKGENALSNDIFSHSFTDIVKSGSRSIIGVAHGITAFNIIGSERTTIQAYSTLKISIIDLEGFKAIEEKFGDSTRTSTFMKYHVTGAPSRPGKIHKVCINGFEYVFKFVNNNTDVANSIYGTLDIDNIVAKFNKYVIYANGASNTDITLSKINISNSELSENVTEVIHIEGLYSPLYIFNNNFEGAAKLLYIMSGHTYPPIIMTNCYSEGNSNGNSLIEIHGTEGIFFELINSVITNTNYNIILDNVKFKQENNYIDLYNKIIVKGRNNTFPDYSYVEYINNFDDAVLLNFDDIKERAFSLNDNEYKLDFHQSFVYTKMYSIISNNEWGYKALVSGKDSVCISNISVSKGDVIYVLVYTDLINNRNILLVDSENTQNPISSLIRINAGRGYKLLKFVCTDLAEQMTPMFQNLGIGDSIGSAYIMINPTMEQLSNLKILSEKCFSATKEAINIENGKQVGLTIFDTQVGLTTWNGTAWVDATSAAV